MTLKANNSDNIRLLLAAADRVAPNRSAQPATVSKKDGAGTLIKQAKEASAEASKLLGR
jgi:hypothetical protein